MVQTPETKVSNQKRYVKQLQLYILRNLLKSSTPFDQTTIRGYFCYLAMCFISGWLFVLLQISLLSVLVGGCLFLQACCLNFRIFYGEIDELVSTKCNDVNQLKIKKKFKEIIEFHGHTKK